MFKKLLSLLLIFTFAAMSGVAAKKSKTEKYDKLYNTGQYYLASLGYKKAYGKARKAPDKAWAAYRTGECAAAMSNNLEAEEWFGKAVEANYSDPLAIRKYADALKSNGKYAEAIAQYNAYKTKVPDAVGVDESIKEAESAQAWKDKPTRYKVENLSALNTKSYDFAVALNPQVSNGIVFTSSREEAVGNKNDNWYGENYFDLFQTSMDNNGKWSIPTNVPEPINTEYSDGVAWFDASGKTMYYTHCKWEKKTNTHCDIFMSTMVDGKWGAPVKLPFNSDAYNCGHPALSPDGKTLYFASDMPGTMGAKDIWMVSVDPASSSFGTPVNLGSGVNTSKNEMFPTVGPNGRLYFSSEGKPGMGGLDIFYTSNEGGVYAEAINPKSPVNSPADDFGMIFNTENTGYLSSGREGGKGNDDIYTFYLPPVKLSVAGRVYDTDTKESLPGATVELFGSDGTSLSTVTGPDGMYRYELKPGVKYKVSASFTGYLTKFHDFTTVGIDEDKDFNYDFDFPLKSTAKPITVPEVFYDLDKSTLRAESKTALDGLIKTLNENPTITVKLTSHTDFRADDNYNLKLSDRRAKSVMDYLAANGIPKDRLTWEGKGEGSPKEIENDEEYAPFKRGDKLTPEFINGLATKELKEKAHQYNRRTEFEVTGTTYVPKN